MIGWLFKGLRTRRLTSRLSAAVRSRPPAGVPGPRGPCRTRELDERRREALARGLPAGRPAGDRGRSPSPRRGALHQLRALSAGGSGQRAVELEPRYELADRRARAPGRRTSEGREPQRAAESRAVGVDGHSLGGPFRRSIHIRHVDTGSDGGGRAGDRRTAEPLLRHAAAGPLLHRHAAPRGRAARHRPRDRADGGAPAPRPTRRCPSRGSWSPPAPTPAAAGSGRARRCSGASTRCCRSTSTSPAILRRRSPCFTACSLPPGGRVAPAPPPDPGAARHERSRLASGPGLGGASRRSAHTAGLVRGARERSSLSALDWRRVAAALLAVAGDSPPSAAEAHWEWFGGFGLGQGGLQRRSA